MPIYFGHKNDKGLSVSPALKALDIDLLRAAPCDVRIVANPRVTQDGYASYITHISAFMRAYIDQKVLFLDKEGYPCNLNADQMIKIPLPPLVVDYNGQIPSKHVETLSKIGFDRVKVQKADNILRFDGYTIADARTIRDTQPRDSTPSPFGAINLSTFQDWIVVSKIISTFLRAHTYPAFTDDHHFIEGYETAIEIEKKRAASQDLTNDPKRQATGENAPSPIATTQDVDMNVPPKGPTKREIKLRKAKPPTPDNKPWGSATEIPNASGLFFPYVPELASADTKTVPYVVERYFLKSLGNTPEQQIRRNDSIRSSWGIAGKTDQGNMLSHLAKVIHLAITSQCRVFPIIADGVYQGSVLSGGRFFIGINGKVVYPQPFDKLQEETGAYHFHSKVLREIVETADSEVKEMPKTMRELRKLLLDSVLSEEDRDEIRRLSVHLNFKEKFLGINSQTIRRILSLLEPGTEEDMSLPLHHTALFSRDPIFTTLSAFGYQAPSFLIENCPRIPIKGNAPPQTFVTRQKTLEIATLDWKKMFEDKEMRNNPRNLSRANRDRTLTGQDKTVVWAALVDSMSQGGGSSLTDQMADIVVEGIDDNLEEF